MQQGNLTTNENAKMIHSEYLLTIHVPPSLEESVVDSLLLLESEHGFSSLPIYVHHHENKGLSVAEQVSGRQKKIRFHIYVDANGLAALLTQLKEQFAGAGIQYWVSPVIEKGEI